jgi:P-type Ca2+ transporter type 2C
MATVANEASGNTGKGQPRLSVLRRPAPGRIRLVVGGLHRQPARAAEVESALQTLFGVRLVSANPLTGHALVLYDANALDEATLLAEGSRRLADVVGTHSATIGIGARSTPEPGPDTHDHSTRPTWHEREATDVQRALGVDPERGLSDEQVAARRREVGLNRFPEPKEPSLIGTFLGQFVNAPSALLTAGAILSVATGGIVDAVLIGAVLVANATIGTVTERSGNRAIAALRHSVEIRARVCRDDKETSVEASELVPGDSIRLYPGDPVPADARVVAAHHLQIEESALTGEPHAVEKRVEPVDAGAVLAERYSMVYRGTTVVGGHGAAIVVATGPRTVLGRLRALAAAAETPETPLEHDLGQVGRVMAVASTGICAGVFGLGLLRGLGPLGAITTAVALAVAAIPEGLPAIATTVLALGSGRMRQKGTLIRSLPAAETLGSVTVVCADKTGTITENRMAARECLVNGSIVEIGGPARSPRGQFRIAGRTVSPADIPGLLDALRIGALCTDAELDRLERDELVVEGTPTEGALLVAAAKAGLDPTTLAREYPRIDRRDRGNGRRHMITVHRIPGHLGSGADRGRIGAEAAPAGLIALAKGSPEQIVELCDRIAHGEQVEPLDDETRARLIARNFEMGGRGLRVLGLAARTLPEDYLEADLAGGFVWHGQVGLADPVRPAVPQAIQALHRAGIRTVMITGDQASTATAIARELRLSRRGSLDSIEAAELATLPPDVLRERVRDVGIFARVQPEQKLAIVRALQSGGEIVAMTGDGVNDAAALRAANVGVAMGQSGTELARELADVVLSTDDFARFVDAVEEGRLVRCNVRRVLHYLLATNASEVWTVTGAVALGLASPLTPLQLLWLNLVSDVGPAVGLATEPAPPNLMRQPPRDPKEPLITRDLRRRIIGESLAISLGTLGVFGLGLLRHGAGPIAQTMAFASLTGAQLLHVPRARSGDRSAESGGVPHNPKLALGVGISVALQVAAVFFPPLRFALGGAALGLGDLLIAVAGSFLPILGINFARALAAPRRPRQLPPGRRGLVRIAIE